MIEYRKIDLARDYSALTRWWAGHGAIPAPLEILPPDGWIAHAGGVDLAASFLYVAKRRIAVIEFTTTNPACAFSRDLVEGVRGLYERLEVEAGNEGCLAVLSFVDPNSWERRTMAKMGYVTSAGSKPHLLFAKSLRFEHAGGNV